MTIDTASWRRVDPHEGATSIVVGRVAQPAASRRSSRHPASRGASMVKAAIAGVC